MAGVGVGGRLVEVVVGGPLVVVVAGGPLMGWEEQDQVKVPGQLLPSVLHALSGSWGHTAM